MTAQPSRLLTKIVSAFAFALACSPTAGLARAVPAGFEDLLLGQREQVEVHLFGRAVGTFSALVKPESLRFDDASAIVSALGLNPLGDTDVAVAMTQALTHDMARNGNLLCEGAGTDAPASGGANGCNFINTTTAAIIFDESRGIANLFLAPEWVERLPEVKSRDDVYHHVSSRAENAFVHSQSLQWSTNTNRSRSIALSGVGAQGVTERGHIGVDWSFSSYRYRRSQNNNFNLGSLYFRQDVGDEHYVQAGRMDQRNLSGSQGGSFGFSLLPVPRFDGVRIGSTNAYINQRAAGNATPVTVMLNTASRVEVYRGEQLLTTQYLDAGVQRLDVNELPEGSYMLRLRILEGGVHTRSEDMPFSKAGAGFDAQGFQWFAQGGRVVSTDRPRHHRFRPQDGAASASDGNRNVAQMGVRKGWGHSVVTSAGVSTVDGKFFGEASVDWRRPLFNGNFSSAASVFSGTDGSHGNTQNISYQNGVGASVYRYQRRSPQGRGKHPSFMSIGDYDSISASVFLPAGAWYVSAGYSHTKRVGRRLFGGAFDRDWHGSMQHSHGERASRREDDRITRAMNISASRSMRVGPVNLSTRVGVSRSVGSGRAGKDHTVFVGLSLNHYESAIASGRSSSNSAGVEVRSGRNAAVSTQYNANKNWSWNDGTPRSLTVGVNGYKTESFYGNVHGDMDSRYGRLSGGVSHAYQRIENKQSTVVSGGYTSSMAIGSSGVYWGSGRDLYTPGAAVAVKVADADELVDEEGGANSQGVVEVLGNGPVVTLGFGQRALMSAEAYQEASISIRDATSSQSAGSVNVYKGAGDSTDFLAPGKLITHHVSAAVSYTYLGRAMSPEGLPLAGARVLNVPGVVVGDDGGFVLDTEGRIDVVYLVHGGELFSLPMMVQGKRDIVQLVGEVVATPIEKAALPQSLRLVPRVNRLLTQLLPEADVTAQAHAVRVAPRV